MKRKTVILLATSAALLCCIASYSFYRNHPKHVPKLLESGRQLNHDQHELKELPLDALKAGGIQHGSKAMPSDFRRYVQQLRESGRYDLSYVKLLEMAWENLPDCFQYISTNDPAGLAERRKSDILATLADFDVELLTIGLPLLLNESEREYVISNVTASLSRKHPRLLVEYAKEHFDEKSKEYAVMRSISALAKNGDIEEATSVLALMKTPFRRKESVAAIAKVIATQYDSVSIAMQWAGLLAAEEDRRTAELAILQAKSDKMTPEGVIQMMDAFHEPGTKTAAISIVVKKLVQQDASSAVEWVNSLPPEIAGKVQGTLAMEAARKDINFGTQIAVSMKGENQYQIQQQRDAIHYLSYLAYKSDPRQVPAWLETLPEPFRQNETGDFASKWICADPSNAKAWIYGLPDGILREKALYGAATSLELHPQVAAELISKMTDKKLQSAAQEQLDMIMASLREQGRLSMKTKGR